ncbi:unknown protein [Cronobacter turicensis z3032]|uniref:Uncharacterized protein n=1 Tax=Cronobacter turicensis (strain DSM 18703 / CCUG 55852 / LMG 23827 / z3032) TaxID=693216 RepID=C9Y005_CROTZ|nr:unknown protein [Cronobacter turicensis z3032]
MCIKSIEVRIDSHNLKMIVAGLNHPNWRLFRLVMQLRENNYSKLAGVAVIRARVNSQDTIHMFIFIVFEVMIYTGFSLNGMEICLMQSIFKKLRSMQNRLMKQSLPSIIFLAITLN